MAIYSLQVKTVSRSAGRSVVAAAAYRAAENIDDERLGVTWDFTRKRGVLHSEIMTPAGAPAWMMDRSQLWNGAEKAEDKSTRRATATVGRDIILALPHELTHAQRLEAVREFAGVLIARYGVAIDFALHAPDRHSDWRNEHAHVLMSTRRVGAAGFGEKTRELDGFRTGSAEIEAIRQLWEHVANRALEAAGLDIRIDSRSYDDQGLDREATVHLGPVASGMERKGEATDLGDRNRAAKERNAERDRIARERHQTSAKIINLAAEREKRAEERQLRAAVRTYDPAKILDIVTRRRSTFDRADLNRLLGRVIHDGIARAALTNRILVFPDVVGLSETEGGPVARYTTKEVLADEAEALRASSALNRRETFAIPPAQVDALLGELRLNDEQRAAFRHATAANGLAIIAGEAGTGKSTALMAVRDGYEALGFRVVGMAWTNAVVQDMRRDGYQDATTIAAELRLAEKGESQLDSRTVVIIDEAAMVSTKHLAAVLRHVRLSRAKLVLAGDDQQLASIERGGLFGALKQAHGAAELHQVIRVADDDQKRAFNLMHERQFQSALRIFAQQGAIRWTASQEEARAALVAQWARDSAADPGKMRFVFAYTNADVLDLNLALREVRRETGALGPDHILETADGSFVFAVNDRIQFTGSAWRRIARDAGLANGALGTITAIDGLRVTVQLDGKPGEERQISFTVGKNYAAGEFDSFRLGYAGTIYKGQGRTLDAAYLYHSRHWRSASSYVALSRHRENVTLFAAAETARDLEQLARQMARVDEARSASEFYIAERPKAAAAGGAADHIAETAMSSDPINDEAGEQARSEAALYIDFARQAQSTTQRRATAEGLAERETEQLAAEEAERYREAEQLERRLEEFRRAKEEEAAEARRNEQARAGAVEARLQEGAIADASSRYARALGEHYDIRDPYHSLARAAMAEYGAFHREQERLEREISLELNPEKRHLLELRKEIERADYMTITNHRLAVISRTIAGPSEAQMVRDRVLEREEFSVPTPPTQVQLFEAGAKRFEDRGRELRTQYRDFVAQQSVRNADRQDTGHPNEASGRVADDPAAAPRPGAEWSAEPSNARETPHAGQELTLEEMRKDPWQAVVLDLPADADREFLDAARMAARAAEVRIRDRVRDPRTPERLVEGLEERMGMARRRQEEIDARLRPSGPGRNASDEERALPSRIVPINPEGSDESAGEARIVAGVYRDPRNERQQQEAEMQRRGRNEGQGTQGGAADKNGDTPDPSSRALDRIRKRRERYEAIDAKRAQDRLMGRSPGGRSR